MAYAGDIITDCFNRTKDIFFPIRPKYWLNMGFVSIMAGKGLGGSYNGGSGSGGSGKGFPSGMSFKQIIAEINLKSLVFLSQYGYFVGIAFIVLYFIGLIFSYLASIFTFVFIDGLVKKEIEIKKSFSEYKKQGKSLFFLRLVVGLVSLALTIVVFYPVISAFFANRLAEFNFWLLIPMFLAVLVYSVPIGIFMFLVNNLVVPIMYAKKMSFRNAWNEFRNIASGNKMEIFLYWLIQLGLAIAAGVASLLIMIPVLLIVIVFVAILLYLKIAAIVIILILAFLIILVLTFLVAVVLVPIPAFFTIFSIEMVKKLEGSKQTKQAAAENSDISKTESSSKAEAGTKTKKLDKKR